MLAIDALCSRLNSALQLWLPRCQNRGGGFWQLDEKTREKIVSSFEDAVRVVGAPSYEEGMEAVARLIRFMSDGLDSMRTPDQLRATLDKLPPLSARGKMMLMLVMAKLPQLLRWGIKMVGEEATRSLPVPSGGRPCAM